MSEETTESLVTEAPAVETPAPEVESKAPAPEAEAKEPTAEKPAAPESYDFQLPEGMEADAEAVTEFSGIAKELGLSQEDANKVAQVGAKMVLRQQEAHAKQVEQWVQEVKNDKDFGGEKLNDNLALARTAVERFGSPELKELLNVTGLGNHPEVVRVFHKIGKAISDDTFVAGGGGPRTKPMAEVMYPSMRNN